MPVKRRQYVMPQIPRWLPYDKTFLKNNAGNISRGCHHKTPVMKARVRKKPHALRCDSQNKANAGRSSSGTILIWQLNAKNNPHNTGRFLRHIHAAQTSSSTMTGSVFPWNPDTISETGLSANSARAQVGMRDR